MEAVSDLLSHRVSVPPSSLSNCALCQFPLMLGDEIEIVSRNDESSRLIITVLSDAPQVISAAAGLWGRCRAAYHAECVDLTKPDLTNALAKAAAYSCSPSAVQTDHRNRWIRESQTENLMNELSPLGWALPCEVFRLIANDLLRHHAVAHIKACWNSTLRNSFFSVDKEVWCTYAYFEGSKYIASLSNTAAQGSELIFVPKSSETIDMVYFAANHLGISGIILSTSSQLIHVDKVAGVWWRAFSVCNLNHKILAESDGIKIRNISCPDSTYAIYSRSGVLMPPYTPIGWPVPPPPQLRLQFLTLNPPKMMSVVTLNDSSTQGYVIGWSKTFQSIVAYSGEPIYAPQVDPVDWLYMPLDDGEILTELWRNRTPTMRGRNFAKLRKKYTLGLKTNYGRSFVAGHEQTNIMTSQYWKLIDTPPVHPSRFFFQELNIRGGTMAFETSKPILQNVQFNLPTPSANNIDTDEELFYYACPSLENLETITMCHMNQSNVISGLLLHYAGGHRECVGQVRPDRLGKSLNLDGGQPFFVGFELIKGKLPQVIEIVMDQADLITEHSMRIGGNGRLEWWWSRRQCQLFCEGAASPETYRGPVS